MDVGKILGPLFDKAGKYAAIRDKAGTYSVIVAVGLVALHHWNVMQLDNIPLPHFVDALYAYILVNAGFAAPFIYRERKARIAIGKKCLQCGRDLEETINYSCPDCGEIKYEKKQ